MATNGRITCWVRASFLLFCMGPLQVFAQARVAIQFEDGTRLHADGAVLMEVANPGYEPTRWQASDMSILNGRGSKDKPLFLRDVGQLDYYPTNRYGLCLVVVTLRDGTSLGVFGRSAFDGSDDTVLSRLPASVQKALRLRTWSREYRGYTTNPTRLLLELRLKGDSIRIWDLFECAFANPADAYSDRRQVSMIAFE